MENFIELRDQGSIKNTLLLDFLLWDFTWNFEDAVINEHIDTTFLEYKERPEMNFRIEKVSCSEFKIQMNRTDIGSNIEQDDGYFLEFVFAVLGDRGSPKRQFMDSSTESLSIVYDVTEMKKEQEHVNYWVIKCVIKMHEITLLQNDSRRKQDELIRAIEQDGKHQHNLKDMAYLMQRESLTDIFSGRQEFHFAVEKASLIQRTLVFADDIANKIRAKKNGTQYTQDLPSDIYLQYILYKELRCIGEYHVLSLHSISHHYGLTYLADECRECMFHILECLGDNEFIVPILLNACMTDDVKLMNEALDVFVRDIKAVTKTESWKNLTGEKLIFAQNILDEAMQKLGHELSIDFEHLNLCVSKEQIKQEESADEASQKSENVNEIADKDTSEAPCGITEEGSLSKKSPTEVEKTF